MSCQDSRILPGRPGKNIGVPIAIWLAKNMAIASEIWGLCICMRKQPDGDYGRFVKGKRPIVRSFVRAIRK